MALTLALGGVMGLAGCTMTPAQAPPPASAATFSDRAQLDAAARETLNRLYQVVPGSRDMVSHAAGVLVFPQVIGGALFVGAEHGRGALLVGGRAVAYYSTTGASIGWQAGGQSKAVVYVFNTRDALQRFQASNGWTVGADATVAVGNVGANGSIDSQTAQQPVVSFVMNNVGLEAGVSLGGSKVTRIVP
jgi:lipid-binding SYLF domain-containing protein